MQLDQLPQASPLDQEMQRRYEELKNQSRSAPRQRQVRETTAERSALSFAEERIRDLNHVQRVGGVRNRAHTREGSGTPQEHRQLSAYEVQRAANVARNHQVLRDLGLE